MLVLFSADDNYNDWVIINNSILLINDQELEVSMSSSSPFNYVIDTQVLRTGHRGSVTAGEEATQEMMKDDNQQTSVSLWGTLNGTFYISI